MLISGPGFLSVPLIEGVRFIEVSPVFTCQVLRTFCVAQTF